ncbi:MAG: hypothetical protein AABM42_06235 [Actinomycetota bacterium]
MAVLAATGAVLLFASSAIARTSFPTTITHDGSVPLGDGGTFVDSGHVTSPRFRCRALRIVTLTGHYPSGRTELLDIDLTSAGGAWATKADLTGTDRVRARARKYTFGRQGHRKVCRADSVVFPAPAP